MCGIVGYVGHSDRAQDVILDGLRRLEYRGYDSAGIAVVVDGKLRVIRAQGKLVNLARRAARRAARGLASASATRAGPPTASRRSATRTRTSPAPSR